MTAAPALLSRCIDTVARAGPQLLLQCVQVAIAELQATEAALPGNAHRQKVADAWRALQRHSGRWPDVFAQRLRAELGRLDADGAAGRGTADRGSSGLSLVGDEAITDTLEVSRLVQIVAPRVEQELAALDGLVSAVLGLDAVRAADNPLRAERLCAVLRGVLADDEPDVEIRAMWLRQMARPLADGLRPLYADLVQLLRDAGVQPAGYRLKLNVGGPIGVRPGAGAASAPGSHARPVAGVAGPQRSSVSHGSHAGAGEIGPAWAGLPHPGVLAAARPMAGEQAYHDFLYEGPLSRYQQPLAEDFYRAVDRELSTIEQAAGPSLAEVQAQQQQREALRAMAVVDRPSQAIGVENHLDAAAWGEVAAARWRAREMLRLKKKAQNLAQVVGLDVVRTLVNQVGQDVRLLAPVREAVVALEPALLRQALANPRFFAEEHHPARRLVEAVAQRSFRFNDEFSSDFDAFFTQVRDTFTALNRSGSDDPQPFEDALRALQRSWGEQDQAAAGQREDGLQKIRFAEERQALADQIAWEMSQRPDLDGVPAIILNFLYETWSLVIAHARLVDERRQVDPGGYWVAVSDLLWSVKKEVTLRRPAKLIEMVPRLVQKLHAGLDMLGKDREETKAFFDALMRLHNPVLKLRRARSRRDARESGFAGLADSAAMPLGDSPAMPLEDALAATGLEPTPTDAAGLDETAAATPEQRTPRKAAQPWLGRHELAAAGFQDTLPTGYDDIGRGADAAVVTAGRDSDHAASTTPDADGAGGSPASAGDAEIVLASLTEGSWVDLYSHGEWLRAQLVWASSKRTLFMFTSRGGRPHSMTRRSCEKLIRDRLMRPVDGGAVVDEALEKALRKAGRRQRRQVQPVL